MALLEVENLQTHFRTPDGVCFDKQGAVLVRPDGHVAWRADKNPINHVDALSQALKSILAGGTTAKHHA